MQCIFNRSPLLIDKAPVNCLTCNLHLHNLCLTPVSVLHQSDTSRCNAEKQFLVGRSDARLLLTKDFQSRTLSVKGNKDDQGIAKPITFICSHLAVGATPGSLQHFKARGCTSRPPTPSLLPSLPFWLPGTSFIAHPLPPPSLSFSSQLLQLRQLLALPAAAGRREGRRR